MAHALKRTMKAAWYDARSRIERVAYTAMSARVVPAYWSTKDVNFGDQLTPVLLASYGFTPVRTPPYAARLVGAGSILEHVPTEYTGVLLGCGLMSADTSASYPRATMLAVRGRLTGERIGAPDSCVLGDPGLLASELVPAPTPKRWTLGLVPHFVDKADPRLTALMRSHPDDVTVVDVQRDPRDVIADIAACHSVLSSSLHGLITADSLGIPNRWMVLSDRVKGDGFKFRDYHSALNVTHEPHRLAGGERLNDLLRLCLPPSDLVPEVKDRLDHLFDTLEDWLGA